MSISPSAPLWDSHFSIRCTVTPQAAGATVQWMLNNNPSIEAIETVQVAPTKRLVWGRASAGLEGNWTCVVGYKGEEGRASLTLTVKGRLLRRELHLKICLIFLHGGCSFSPFALSQESSSLPKTIPKCTLLWGLQPLSPACSHLV